MRKQGGPESPKARRHTVHLHFALVWAAVLCTKSTQDLGWDIVNIDGIRGHNSSQRAASATSTLFQSLFLLIIFLNVLRLKVGLWNSISFGGSICMQIVWQGAIIFEYIWMLTTSFFLAKLQISYFLASNSRTRKYIYIYMYLIASLRSYHRTTPKIHVYTSLVLFDFSFVLHVHWNRYIVF